MGRHAARENEDLDRLDGQQKDRAGRWDRGANECHYAPTIPLPAALALADFGDDPNAAFLVGTYFYKLSPRCSML